MKKKDKKVARVSRSKVTPRPRATASTASGRERERLRQTVFAAFPTSWLDPMLTGPRAVVPPEAKWFTQKDIERLVGALKARVMETFK